MLGRPKQAQLLTEHLCNSIDVSRPLTGPSQATTTAIGDDVVRSRPNRDAIAGMDAFDDEAVPTPAPFANPTHAFFVEG
jgi:hypothetical protein